MHACKLPFTERGKLIGCRANTDAGTFPSMSQNGGLSTVCLNSGRSALQEANGDCYAPVASRGFGVGCGLGLLLRGGDDSSLEHQGSCAFSVGRYHCVRAFRTAMS